MKRKTSALMGLAVVMLLTSLFTGDLASAAEAGKVTGKLERVTRKFQTFCLMTKQGPEIIKFTEDTVLKNTDAKSLPKLRSGVHLIVDYTVKDGEKVADTVTLKVAKVDSKDLIKTEEVAALVDAGPEKKNFLIIDARPTKRYKEGYIPGAASLPFHSWDKKKDSVLPDDKSTKLIFYCGGVTCPLSPKSAAKAKELGYTDVKVYHDGMPAWKKAGEPVMKSVAALKELVDEAFETPDKPPFFVLIDLRSDDEIAGGYIPFATKMSAEDVIQNVPDFPKYRRAHVVLYTQDAVTKEAVEALHQLVRWKYKAASILDGGFEAWKKAGHKTASGEPAKDIKFAKKVAKDEIPVAGFKEILKKQPGTVWIIDVRSPEEFNMGSVPGAKSIPLKQLQKDVSDIPKDKELIFVCNTGAISSIAEKLMRKKGFKTRYLNATIKYEDGKYTILE